jgi:hypothetical protein
LIVGWWWGERNIVYRRDGGVDEAGIFGGKAEIAMSRDGLR